MKVRDVPETNITEILYTDLSNEMVSTHTWRVLFWAFVLLLVGRCWVLPASESCILPNGKRHESHTDVVDVLLYVWLFFIQKQVFQGSNCRVVGLQVDAFVMYFKWASSSCCSRELRPFSLFLTRRCLAATCENQRCRQLLQETALQWRLFRRWRSQPQNIWAAKGAYMVSRK